MPPIITPIAISEQISPCQKALDKNGFIINPLVAPTNCIVLISKRFEFIIKRTVFPIKAKAQGKLWQL